VIRLHAHVEKAAEHDIARRLGNDISEFKPILDSRLPDGSPVAAVIPPCSVNGITLTIRKFTARNFTMNDLVATGTLTRDFAAQLERQGARQKERCD